MPTNEIFKELKKFIAGHQRILDVFLLPAVEFLMKLRDDIFVPFSLLDRKHLFSICYGFLVKNWRFGDFVWILEHLLASGLRGKVAPSAKKPRRAKKLDARPGVRNGTTNDMHGKTYVYSEVKTKPD